MVNRASDLGRASLPVFLDDVVQARLAHLASAKGLERSDLVNELLIKDIELNETATQPEQETGIDPNDTGANRATQGPNAC